MELPATLGAGVKTRPTLGLLAVSSAIKKLLLRKVTAWTLQSACARWAANAHTTSPTATATARTRHIGWPSAPLGEQVFSPTAETLTTGNRCWLPAAGQTHDRSRQKQSGRGK